MLVRWLPVAALFAAAAIVACAPPTLPPGADQGGAATTAAGAGDDDDTTTTKKPAATTDTTTTAPATTTAAATTTPPATFDTLYADLQPTCGTCHGSSGTAPTFFGADEPSTYADFKTNGFNKSNGLVTPPSHPGGLLSADQASALSAWVTADPG